LISNFQEEKENQLEITKAEHKLVKVYEGFQKQRNRLLKGYKEAVWNNKYMELIKG